MKLEKAIEILGEFYEESEDEETIRGNEAITLGIEALRVVKEWREQHRDLGFLLMSGETEE